MLTLYAWPTPNGQKAFLMLEELGEPYETIFVNIAKNDQFEPDFLKIAPNNKIPALVDMGAASGPVSLFESGAILHYLVEKYGRFIPEGQDKWKALKWPYWQVGGLGPMLGQLAYFGIRAGEKLPHAIKRFGGEVDRVFGDLDYPAYGTPKAGMLGLSRDVAKEYRKQNIRANVIVVGWVMTEALDENMPVEGQELMLEHNLVRYLGDANDIAEVAAFLASDQSRYISGASIVADGGLHRPFGGLC